MLVWVAGGVVALFGALALAELAALFPRAGGTYVYLAEAYGRLPAFLLGWTALFLVPSGLAALALVFAEYLGAFVPLSGAQTRVAAAVVLALLAAVSYRSVRLGGAIQNVSTAVKVLALAGLAAAAFVFGGQGTGALAPLAQSSAGTWDQLGVALIAVLWAYNGWQDLTALGGEVRDPSRSLPRALIGSTVTVMLVYLVVNAAYLAVLPVDVMARSPLVAADVMTRVIGTGGSSVVAVMVMVSTFGALNAVMVQAPRVFYAMADDGLFFRSIADVHPRHCTPHVAIAFTALVAVAFVSVRTFEQLTEAVVVGIWPFMALAVGAVLVLRWRRPDLPRLYRTPGYPVVPLVFVAASLALMTSALVQHPVSTAAGLGLTLLGIPVYLAWGRKPRRGR
jgi:amino acid transporter